MRHFTLMAANCWGKRGASLQIKNLGKSDTLPRGTLRRALALLLFALVGAAAVIAPTPALAATITWTGSGANANWTTATNWVGNVAPVAVDALVFPEAAVNKNNNNDFANGTNFNSITISGNNYLITGNSINLSAGLTDSATTTGASFAPTVTLGAAQTFAITSAQTLDMGDINLNGFLLTVDTTAGGAISTAHTVSGGGGITKNGTGALVLGGNSNYTGGTTVNAGTLAVNGSIASPVTVNAGGTLSGTGTINNAVTVNSGGMLSPGASPGIINTGNVTLNSSSTLTIELNGPTVGTQYDQLNVTGTVSLGGATLSVILGFTPTTGQVFTIINNDGADAVTGTFAGLAEGSTFTAGGHSFLISYVGGTGNDVTLLDGGATAPIPTLPQWAMTLFTLSLLTLATWELAGRPALVGVSVRGSMVSWVESHSLLRSVVVGQGMAGLGLLLYAVLIGPLVPHDGVGAFLAGVLLGVMVECYRRSR